MNTQTRPEFSQGEIATLVSLFSKGQFAQMEAHAQKLTTRSPNQGLYWQALGVARYQQGRYQDALKPLQNAVAFLPGDSQTHNNLANALVKLGRLTEAEASYCRALELSPNFAEAHFNRGNTLARLGRPDDAEQSYRQALEVRPDFDEALGALATHLMSQKKWPEAFSIAFIARQTRDTPGNRALLVRCLKGVSFTSTTDELRAALVRAISEPWSRASELAGVCASVIKLNPDVRACMKRSNNAWPQRLTAQTLYGPDGISTLADDIVLRALLEATPICDIELERFLTMVRHTMLEAAGAPIPVATSDAVMRFHGAMACQCFANEYVFALDENEAAQATALRDMLIDDMNTGRPVSPLRLAAVAAYFPLHSLPSPGRLLTMDWPEPLSAVITQQVSEPAEEALMRDSIPRLTPIHDKISKLVRDQYEENPYPRWLKAAPGIKPTGINDYIRQRFPLSPYLPRLKGDHIAVLIAGCGTGQQSIETARLFSQAQVLAVDLSLSSLCYAKRKSQQLGLSSISYAQADIMNLGGIDRKFDVIESSGVLHHLADPMEGWRVLLSRLRGGGLMLLGFYSETARRHVVEARDVIRKNGFDATSDAIRKYRQYLTDMDDAAWLAPILQSPDFFSVSTCRDLLSHVQEHRMTLAEIGTFLKKNKLQLIGFEIDPNILHAYKLRFPNDQAAINLANWQVFEHENPDTFSDMYQFWVQKNPA